MRPASRRVSRFTPTRESIFMRQLLAVLRRLAFRPGNRKQKRAFLQRLDVMLHTAVQRENALRFQLHALAVRQVQAYFPLKAMNGNGAIRMVVVHMTSLLHEDKNNSEVCVLYQGLRTASRVLLPRGRIPEFLNLITNIRVDHCVRELRESSEVVAIIP